MLPGDPDIFFLVSRRERENPETYGNEEKQRYDVCGVGGGGRSP